MRIAMAERTIGKRREMQLNEASRLQELHDQVRRLESGEYYVITTHRIRHHLIEPAVVILAATTFARGMR
eukprot:6190236-Pleurochrysis_carterae.AAC.2